MRCQYGKTFRWIYRGNSNKLISFPYITFGNFLFYYRLIYLLNFFKSKISVRRGQETRWYVCMINGEIWIIFYYAINSNTSDIRVKGRLRTWTHFSEGRHVVKSPSPNVEWGTGEPKRDSFKEREWKISILFISMNFFAWHRN